MSFDVDAFKRSLAAQCATFNLESSQAWNLAPNVFAVRAREKGGQDWNTILYFDSRQLKQRDEESGARHMAREIQLLMMIGFTVGRLSEDPDDHVRIAYFGDDPIGDNPGNIVNYASQLLVQVDNNEAEWLDYAEPVSFN